MSELSEEEKKAYDTLIMLKYFTQEKEDKEAIQIILNLIESQQKEIKELKKDKLELINKYHVVHLKDVEKEKEKNKSIVYNYEMVVDKLENSTPNDKIKTKIEYYKKIDNAVGVRILQSLLEKE